MDKPTHVKPALYAMFYEYLKDIAKQYGYNLLIHGSMNRDLDLVAIPWIDKPGSEQEMIKDFQMYCIGKEEVKPDGTVDFSVLPGCRHSYVINLNRGNKHGEWVRFEDKQYYLDISVVQVTSNKLNIDEKFRGKTLNEWKIYSNEDNIPIKTMKYIKVLEEIIEKFKQEKHEK